MAERSYARAAMIGVTAAASCGWVLAVCDFVIALVTTDAALAGQTRGLLQGLVQSFVWAMGHAIVVGSITLLVAAARGELLRRRLPRWLVDGALLVAAAAIYMIAIGIPSLKRPSAVKIGIQCVIAVGFAGLCVVGIALAARVSSTTRSHRVIGLAGVAVLSVAMLVANQVVYPILLSRMHSVIIVLPTVWLTLVLDAFLGKQRERARTASIVAAVALVGSVLGAVRRDPVADFVVFRMTGYAKVAAMSADAVRAALGRGAPRVRYACAVDADAPPATATGPAIASPWTVVILVDTLRSDRVFGPSAAPGFTQLAAQSRVYTNAHSQFGCTDHSVRSMLVSGYDFERPGDRATALVAGLRSAGVLDVAVASTAITRRFYEAAGLTPVDARASSDDAVVIEQATSWLAARVGRKAFLWVHVLGAHETGFGERRSYDERSTQSADLVSRFVADIDRLVGRDGATVVLLSDHGESLGAHGLGEHCATAYDAVSRVPLLIRGPGITPAVIDDATELIDVAPTILALEGQPCAWCTGRALLSRDSSETCAVHISKVIRSKVIGLTCGRWKLIEDRTFGFAELYDLTTDPGETRNLASDHPDVVAEMRGRLKHHLRSTQACPRDAARPHAAPE